ncbi:MAG TPA: ClpXP protease specificity-enhancing factor SspB [Acetobacteraceae bacterium]|nr:ClpXP protease specificity-enhancing factor SspB [Acetobacteraceae bacterium]
MEDDTEQRPESLLPYEEWMAEAMREVVALAVSHAAANGLPGEHHFYITFRTDYPGVVMPPRLRAQYPQEMTIVLQHQFWDLKFDPVANTISVGLSFGGVPASMVVPLGAVTAFVDPYVRYGLRFTPVPAGEPPPEEPEAEPPPPQLEQPSETPQVVSLDAFRRRPPTKE